LFITAGSSLSKFRLEPYHAQIIAVIVTSDLIVESLGMIPGIKRNILYNFAALLEFWLYAYYYLQIIRNKRISTFIRIYLCGLPVGWLILVIGMMGLVIWNTIFHAIGSVVIVLLSAWFYYQLFTAEKLTRLSMSFEFWIATALIVYYSCDLPFLGMLNWLSQKSPGLASKLVKALQIVNIIFYSIICYAFICLRRQRRSPSL
jgi:hypothetical protein